MIKRIVSGGQTGVDQAALLIAKEFMIPIGGWCPKGGLDENGICILETYPSLREAPTSDPDERTKLNICDSDGTLIIVPCWPLSESIQDGTRLTIANVAQQGKPHLIINLVEGNEAIDKIGDWISTESISVLNIAGPRESSRLGIHLAACDFFRKLFLMF